MVDFEESDLVVEAQQGCVSAFEDLVRRYQNLITSMAYSRTGDLQRSEDIAQQAFLTAWEKRSELRDPNRFGSWLKSITRNLALNSNRKSNRIDQRATQMTASDEPLTAPIDSTLRAEQQELLWASVKNIPEQYREPLILFYREEKSVAQVAELLELSTDAVKQRLARGRSMLKAEVAQFVEDLLGTTKPKPSFASSVIVAIPAASTVATNAVVKGGISFGIKAIVSKLGIAMTGPVLGVLGGLLGGAVGVAGGYFGTRVGMSNATSEEEKRLIWRFFLLILIETIVFSIVTITVPSLAAWSIGSMVIYFAVILAQILRFNSRQRALHEIHGRPAYLNQYDSTESSHQPVKLTVLKNTLLASSIGYWAWLFVLCGIRGNWTILAISAVVWCTHMYFRLSSSTKAVTAASQLRLHAYSGILNSLLSSALFLIAGFFGVTFSPIPNWAISLFVLLVGSVVAIACRQGANRMEATANKVSSET